MIKKLSLLVLSVFLLSFVLLAASGCASSGPSRADKEKQAQIEADRKKAELEAAQAAEEAKKAEEERKKQQEEERIKAEQEAQAAEEARKKAAEEAKMNKVLVGPYETHGKAKTAVLKLRKLGFGDAFVKEYDGKFWAQIGLFKSAESANAILDQAKHKKYNGQVIRE
jgi:cell division septation protein DedD